MSENRNYDNFLKSIDVWWEEASPVRAELLRKLLENLENLENSPNPIKEYRSNASIIFDNFDKDCHKSHEIKIIDNKTSINEEIRGKVKKVQFASGFRNIIEVTSDCKLGESLERLNFYPMLIKPINRLVYARVAETRISFVTDRINRANIPVNILPSRQKIIDCNFSRIWLCTFFEPQRRKERRERNL